MNNVYGTHAHLYLKLKGGLYYKHIMIVNNDSSLTLSDATQFGASLADNARVIIYDRNIFIIQTTGFVLIVLAGNTKGGSITLLLASYLTLLESAV